MVKLHRCYEFTNSKNPPSIHDWDNDQSIEKHEYEERLEIKFTAVRDTVNIEAHYTYSIDGVVKKEHRKNHKISPKRFVASSQYDPEDYYAKYIEDDVFDKDNIPEEYKELPQEQISLYYAKGCCDLLNNNTITPEWIGFPDGEILFRYCYEGYDIYYVSNLILEDVYNSNKKAKDLIKDGMRNYDKPVTFTFIDVQKWEK